jgi:hypothetical protein
VGGLTDIDLWDRGIATLLASWEANARGSAGAEVQRLDGVAAATFPTEPERGIYNNAVLRRGLGQGERVAAVDAMEAAYGEAGVERFAAWVHESDEEMQVELEGRGYAVAETTRMMALSLEDTTPPDPRSTSPPRAGLNT